MKQKNTPIITLLIALLFVPCFQALTAEPADDATVYWAGKKRVHLADCVRYTRGSPEEQAKHKQMTYAEAKAKSLPLCSRCPGSTTKGKHSSGASESESASAASDSASDESTGSSVDANATVYWEGKKRVHLGNCVRYTRESPEDQAKFKKMTYAEAEAKGLPLCSRCPGSATK